MTIESNILKNVFQGNGVTVRFPFDFKIWEENQISITIEDLQGFTSAKEPDKVTISENGNGEVILYLDSENKIPYPEGYKIAITRNMPFLQKSDYINGTRINTEVFEDDLDKAAAERQQLLEALSRAVMTSPTSDKNPKEILQDFLSRYYEIMEKYPEIIFAFNTIYPRIEEILRECIANKDLSKAWAESPTSPDGDPNSKSAKEWARIASDVLPVATDVLLGKVKGGGNIDIDTNGTLNVSQAILDDMANLQSSKIDKSAISSAIDSASEETVASSKAVRTLKNKIPTNANIAGMGMPSGRLINIGAQGCGYVYTAPYSGFICFRASSQQTYGWIALDSGDIASELIGDAGLGLSIFLPVLKGKKVVISHDGVKITDLFFVKAVGE